MKDNKVLIVTGGTKGIGLATVELLASEGAVVYACARHEKIFSKDNIVFHALDVTDTSSCEQLVKDIIHSYGRIDGLVADAGITKDSLTCNMTEDMFDSVVTTNMKGVFNIVKSVVPTMDSQGYGSIVTVSSIVGEYGNIGQVNYSASKAGVIAMTKSWAKEFARNGKKIRVNSVAPGYILTDMLKTVPQKILEKLADQTILKRLGEPEEIANVISFLLSDKASYVTDTVIDVNGGMKL